MLQNHLSIEEEKQAEKGGGKYGKTEKDYQ